MKLTPLDENQQPVDWWFLYKVPKLTSAKSDGTAAINAVGYEYAYFDASSPKLGMSPNVLTTGKGALDLTLAATFDSPDATTGWILYNDEMPSSTDRKDNNSLGHTKGVIAFDTATNTAIWLLHSWPKFADPDAKGLPTAMYGQTYLCLALDLATASLIAKQMATHQQPQTYLPHLPASLDKTDPLYRLTQPLDATPPGDSDVLEARTRGGLAFKVIAKNRQWAQDFWNDLVGPTLQEDLKVETWIRGAIPPTLDKDGVHKTFDIKFVDFRKIGGTWAWPETKDHAKWGITSEGNWVCVGDINRMISQEKRGGCTIAFQNPLLWKNLDAVELLIPPPGMNMTTAKAMIAATHAPETPPVPKPVAPKNAGG
jgi:deoxyribonuclease-2